MHPAPLFRLDDLERRPDAAGARLLLRAIEAANNCISLADPDRPDLPLSYVNHGFTAATGYRPEEALGRNCRFLQHPPPVVEADEAAEFDPARQRRELELLRASLAQGRPSVTLLRNFRRDGRPFWNEFYLTPVIDDGRTVAVVGVQNDVTTRVEAQHRLIDARDRERRSLASELHDTVAQDLQALTFRAEMLLEEPDPAALRAELAEVAGDARRAAAQARALARRTMPAAPDDADDFAEVLAKLAGRVGQVWGIDCRFTSGGDVGAVDPESAVHLTRIVQEAVANAVRHGRAARVDVALDADADGGLTLAVRDHGTGLSDAGTSAGIGVQSMRTRAGLIGGRFDLAPAEGGGVRVAVHVPPAGG